MSYKNYIDNLVKFCEKEVTSRGFSKVMVGLSGGVDSAVVALLLKKGFGKNLTVIIIPSTYSSVASTSDALSLCKKFDINYYISDISSYMELYNQNNSSSDNLRYGNFTARIRMATLYDYSARLNSMVIGTSNKSEIMLGYGTMYGDLAYIINPIGDIFKSDLYKLAKSLGVITEILDKKPSADLYSGQSDEDELGYKYSDLDRVLALISSGKDISHIKSIESDSNLVDFCFNRYNKNRFKVEGYCIFNGQNFE